MQKKTTKSIISKEVGRDEFKITGQISSNNTEKKKNPQFPTHK